MAESFQAKKTRSKVRYMTDYFPLCSGFSYKSRDNKHFLGRTYDMFGTLDLNRITVLAPGYSLNTSPTGKGDNVKLMYGLIGNAISLSPTSLVFTDGVNEKGLMGTLQNFPSYAHYDTQKSKDNQDLHPAFFIPYMLGLCSSVSEVCKRIESVNLTGEMIAGSHMAVHYLFSDESGEAVIIEPDENGIKAHRNTIGVMTNAPGYLWQLDNLKNYVAVSNIHTPPRDFLGIKISTFGNGTGGSFGLPGSFSSPDRFVRLAFAKNYAEEASDEEDAVNRMFNIFSVVTVPEGMLREKEGGDSEKTLCTCVLCAESRTYYFSPFSNRRINSYSLFSALDKIEGEKKCMFYSIPSESDIACIV